ncbi:hypothetical protein EV193_107160 [Herbihabitans rhizosphaerae]|uniref:Integral membrane protein n=1 Tax=Herbihabitans rhizosphaerae TaxID=1872711 RepID=A0A4Q7KIW1_9PSEU|nr:hypothetical protein [Herbihabitans rhizosphaerae]RZS36479.1 hypothetical protein EV193_107160 [Herbihabitans rhizosphaerae]
MRNGIATLLVLIGCLLSGPAVVAVAVEQRVADRQEYLDAVGDLADDPAVRGAVAELLADKLATRLGSRPSAAARDAVDSAARKAVDSPAFRTWWIEANSAAHPQILAMLRGQNGAARLQGDSIVLDMRALVDDVRVPGLGRLPAEGMTVELAGGSAIKRVVPVYTTLEDLSAVLPIASAVLILGGIALAVRRRGALITAGIGVAVVAGITLAIGWLARGLVADQSPSPQLAGGFYDAMTSGAGVMLWILAGAGVAAVIVGVIAGMVSPPSRTGRGRADTGHPAPAVSGRSDRHW